MPYDFSGKTKNSFFHGKRKSVYVSVQLLFIIPLANYKSVCYNVVVRTHMKIMKGEIVYEENGKSGFAFAGAALTLQLS